MICTGYEVNAFVAGWKVQTFANIRGHLAQQPDLSQDGSVFRLGLEVELDEPLERATLLGVGELPRLLPEILPRGQEAINRSTRFMTRASNKLVCCLKPRP